MRPKAFAEWVRDNPGPYPPCGRCDGTGFEECSRCDGEGAIKLSLSRWDDCLHCDGEGGMPCDACDGRGDTAYTEYLEALRRDRAKLKNWGLE